jgi:hypothetical protein
MADADLEVDPYEIECGALKLYAARERLRFSLPLAEEMLRILMAVFVSFGIREDDGHDHTIHGVDATEWLVTEICKVEERLVASNACSDDVILYLNAFETLIPEFVESRNAERSARLMQLHRERGLHGAHAVAELPPDPDPTLCLACCDAPPSVELTAACAHDPVVCPACAPKITDRCPVCQAELEQ